MKKSDDERQCLSESRGGRGGGGRVGLLMSFLFLVTARVAIQSILPLETSFENLRKKTTGKGGDSACEH